MGIFALNVAFDRGWCTLTIAEENKEIEISAHSLNDSHSDLIHGVAELARGWQCISCRWAREVGGGYFVDLVQDPQGSVNISVHESKYSNESTTFGEAWSPSRANVVFECRVENEVFFTGFATALQKIRSFEIDSSGYISEWGWNFPFKDAAEIERHARRYGFRPAVVVDDQNR